MTDSTSHIASFGEALRLERERRSVSLQDIAQTTKLTTRTLQALESEAFDRLPGGILSKGVVRSYVRFLGLDESAWVERFLEASRVPQLDDPVHERDWVAFAMNVSNSRGAGRVSMQLRWTGVVALLLLLAGFGWFVWSYVHTRVAVVPPNAAQHNTLASSNPSQP